MDESDGLQVYEQFDNVDDSELKQQSNNESSKQNYENFNNVNLNSILNEEASFDIEKREDSFSNILPGDFQQPELGGKKVSFGPAFTANVKIQNQGLTKEEIQKRDMDNLKMFKPPKLLFSLLNKDVMQNRDSYKSPRFEIRTS